MPHVYNSTGVKMPGGNFTIPDGEYVLEITSAIEGQSKKGDYQVKVDFTVAEGSRKGFPVKFFYVTFLDPKAKGAGQAVHFVKSIGEPWEGEFDIDPTRWYGKRLVAYLEAEEYNGFTNMKVKWVAPDVQAPTEKPGEDKAEPEEVPF